MLLISAVPGEGLHLFKEYSARAALMNWTQQIAGATAVIVLISAGLPYLLQAYLTFCFYLYSYYFVVSLCSALFIIDECALRSLQYRI